MLQVRYDVSSWDSLCLLRKAKRWQTHYLCFAITGSLIPTPFLHNQLIQVDADSINGLSTSLSLVQQNPGYRRNQP